MALQTNGEEGLNKLEIERVQMGFFNIISDGRTNFGTKIIRLIQLTFDLIFVLLIGFAVVFFYLDSPVGWIFIVLGVIRYLTKND